MPYRDTVLGTSPQHYHRLGASVAPPAGGGFDVNDGKILGEGPTVDGLQGDWVNWSWSSSTDLHWETGSRSKPANNAILDLTRGPYGSRWLPDPGSSNAGFYFHSDAGIDWSAGALPYTHLIFTIKWDGTGPLPSADVYFEDGAYALMGSRVTITANPANSYPFPKNGEVMWRFDVTLTGAATPGSLGSFGMTPGTVIHQMAFIINGLAPSSPFYIDEVQLVRTRAAFDPYNIADGTENAQTFNWVPNHMVLLNKPTPPVWNNGVGSMDWTTPTYRPYWDAFDGNCSADSTYRIMKWATTKWGFANRAPIVIGGSDNGAALNVIDLAAAIACKESSWRQDMPSDWEDWWDPQTGVRSPIFCNCTLGIGQTKFKFHPPWPHGRLSTAWAVERHMAAIRMHYAGLSQGASGPYPTTNNLRRSVNAWFSGDGAAHNPNNWAEIVDGINSSYVCQTIGGTVNDPWQTDHGRTYDPTNPAAAFPSYMAMRLWEDAARKNSGYWTY